MASSTTSGWARWWAMLVSVLAAAFGVQSQQNYQRDFSSSTPLPFIVLGLIFTVCLVGGLFLLVKTITG